MFRYFTYMMPLLLMATGLQAASWTENCPQMEVESPFVYKRIWSPDDTWARKPMAANQPILMSCGNWKVMGRDMVCYFGGYKTTYDYAVSKPIPEGANCQRDGQCKFKCTSQAVPKKIAPKLKAPTHLNIQ